MIAVSATLTRRRSSRSFTSAAIGFTKACALEKHPRGRSDATGHRESLALVFIPAGIFIFGLIYLVSPRREPPSQAWANGTYVNACCAPVVLRDGLLVAGKVNVKYRVDEDKRGYFIAPDHPIGVQGSTIELAGNSDYIPFNNNSEALPAVNKAEALHLYGLDDSVDYKFVKR